MSEELKVTSIEELRNDARGDIIELPPFSKSKKFYARLRRLSMLDLVKSGKIPNELVLEANKLFASGVAGAAKEGIKDPNMLSRMFDTLDVVLDGALVEPTYKELKDNGIILTDQQRIFIFSYVQAGVDALKSFREPGGDITDNRNI